MCNKSKRNAPALGKSPCSRRGDATRRGVEGDVFFSSVICSASLRARLFHPLCNLQIFTTGILVKSVVKVAIKVCSFCEKMSRLFSFMIKFSPSLSLCGTTAGDRTTAMYPGIKLCENVQSVSVEQNFPVVLFIVLYKLVLTFESVDEILKPSGLLNISY